MSSASMDLQFQERSQMDGYYTLDTWRKPSVPMAPPPVLPNVGYKRGAYVKPKKSKLRWYLVFGLSLLITAVVVVVIALVVHFTTSQNKETVLKDEYYASDDYDHAVDHSHGNIHPTTPRNDDHTIARDGHHHTTIKKTKPTSSMAKQKTDSLSTSVIAATSSPTPKASAAPLPQTTESSAITKTTITSSKKTSKISTMTNKTVSATTLKTTSSSIKSSSQPTLTHDASDPSLSLGKLDSSVASTIPSAVSTNPGNSTLQPNLTIDIEKVTHQETWSTNQIDTTDIPADFSHTTPEITPPEFIRDHENTITTDDVATDVTTVEPSDVTTIAKIADDTVSVSDDSVSVSAKMPTDATTVVVTREPFVTFVSSNVTLASKSISLLFEAINVPDWDYLQIFRYEEGSIGEVVAMVSAGRHHPILDIYDSSFRSQISFKSDALSVTLQTDIFNCNQTTNFTSVLGTYTTTYVNSTTVHVIQEPPSLTVPYAIVEGRNMTMTCSVELFGSNGRLVWKFRPPGIDMFFDLSSSHTTTQEWNNCTTIINSTMMFTPQSHDNGSDFRCEVLDADVVAPDNQPLYKGTEFLVIPSNFCQDKRTYTVHPHPYNPCNLVVYCFQTGPLVYHINCSPGTCYDKNKTQCVPVE